MLPEVVRRECVEIQTTEKRGLKLTKFFEKNNGTVKLKKKGTE